MHIAILGRLSGLSMAELERLYGPDTVHWFSKASSHTGTALVDTKTFNIETLGGTVKAGTVIMELPGGNWQRVSQEIIQRYSAEWSGHEEKITLGISAYNFGMVSARDVQKVGITIKQKLKKAGVSLRLVPNVEPLLGSATSHHNKLGLSPSKIELLIVRGDSGKIIIAESTGAQNITALARRDQARPRRDAFVGMLPPKLALIMINLAAGSNRADSSTEEVDSPTAIQSPRLLDPFCGTGVVLQEAALMGYSVYGTDHSEKMIRYSRDNINWLEQSHHIKIDWFLHEDDARSATWQAPVDLIASETYLGQPFSAPPSPGKLEEVRGNVNHILSTFLENLHPQLSPGTPLCLAVPAWRSAVGTLTHLPLISQLDKLGYARASLKHVTNGDLLYYRQDQVVARELLILTRA